MEVFIMSKHTIDLHMTWDEWFHTACDYYDIPFDQPLVNEIIHGKQCCVTPQMVMDTLRDLEMSRQLFIGFTMARDTHEDVLDMWTGFIQDAFRHGETFLPDPDDEWEVLS
jgi:hypothetical protein